MWKITPRPRWSLGRKVLGRRSPLSFCPASDDPLKNRESTRGHSGQGEEPQDLPALRPDSDGSVPSWMKKNRNNPPSAFCLKVYTIY